MRLALMQPYFFPYLGYFQLLQAVDQFLLYDDVQYITRGWVNRNRILLNGTPAYFTLPLEAAPITANINERVLAKQELPKAQSKMLGQLHAAYRQAPYYPAARTLVEAAFSCEDPRLEVFLANALAATCRYLGIDTPMQLSSVTDKQDAGKSGQYRTIAACCTLGADEYINPIGGTDIYDRALFVEHDITLHFLKTQPYTYDQGVTPFVPHLSILDVIAHNPPEQIQAWLRGYELV